MDAQLTKNKLKNNAIAKRFNMAKPPHDKIILMRMNLKNSNIYTKIDFPVD
jgi:hypothetical protein